MQVLEADLEVMAVILPRHAIDAGSRLALERVVGFPELIAINVVQERGTYGDTCIITFNLETAVGSPELVQASVKSAFFAPNFNTGAVDKRRVISMTYAQTAVSRFN